MFIPVFKVPLRIDHDQLNIITQTFAVYRASIVWPKLGSGIILKKRFKVIYIIWSIVLPFIITRSKNDIPFKIFNIIQKIFLKVFLSSVPAIVFIWITFFRNKVSNNNKTGRIFLFGSFYNCS